MTTRPMPICVSFGVHRGEKLFSVKEVAEDVLGGMSQRFVRDLIDKGQLEALNVAVDPNSRRELLVSESALDDFFRRRTIGTSGKLPTPALKSSKASRKSGQAIESGGFMSNIKAHLRERDRNAS